MALVAAGVVAGAGMTLVAVWIWFVKNWPRG
jgi:hypothetical protein